MNAGSDTLGSAGTGCESDGSAGISTRPLADAYPAASVTGLDLSTHFLAVAELRERCVHSLVIVGFTPKKPMRLIHTPQTLNTPLWCLSSVLEPRQSKYWIPRGDHCLQNFTIIFSYDGGRDCKPL